MGFSRVDYGSDFQRDLKRLMKKFPSLTEDLDSLIRGQLTLYHLHRIDNGGVVPMEGMGGDVFRIYKVRKFACKSLKGRGVKSGIRVIHAYFTDSNKLEFIEIYHKSDQENEDSDRAQRYCREQMTTQCP